MRSLLKFLLILIVVFGTSVVVSAQQNRLVGNLRNSNSADGCGCYFSFTKADEKARRLMFFSSDESNSKDALMNIDGRDVRLRFVSETKPKGKVKLGSRYTSRYQSGDVTVDVVQIITWLCPPKDDSCEVTKYSVTLTVKKGNRTQVVRGVGECGC